MELNPWNSILEKVKPHIPTIDFKSLSPEDDGMITIFQRPDGLSLDVLEDFQEDKLVMEDAELEELLKSQRSEEKCSQSVKFDGLVENTTATHWDAQHSVADVETSALERNGVELKRAEQDASVKSQSEKGCPVLSFALLDRWDLDKVLQNLPEDKLSLQRGVSEELARINADGEKYRSQDNNDNIIMENIIALYKRQSVSDLVKSPSHISQNNVCNKPSKNMAAGSQLSHQECPTVYIDLRGSDPSIKPPRTSPKLSSDYKSPAKHNTRQETPPAKKPNLQVHLGSTGDRHQQQLTSQQEHQKILRELRIHLPTKSVKGKQSSAERTDVLYDFGVSHLQPISTLPAGISNKGHVLLIVGLSSPGMVKCSSRGKRKYLDPVTKANIYSTLVAWFLSLVGPDPRQDKNQIGTVVPFWVAGLQQMWTKDGLELHVLAVSPHSHTPTKKDTDTHTTFHNHVYRFLSETFLTSVDQESRLVHLPSSYLKCFVSAVSNKKVIDRTFGRGPGFYWQTVETQECVCKGIETAQELHTEVSFALWHAFSLHPSITHNTLQCVLDSGLDVCGLRLLYPSQEVLSPSIGAEMVIQRAAETCQPVLALAVRGPHAHSVLKDLTNSSYLLLPKKSETTSRNLNHIRAQESPHLYSPRLASEVHRELCFWFSGRLSGGGPQSQSQPFNKAVPSGDRIGCSTISARTPALLCATTKGDMLLVVSPLVPPCFYIPVLAVCEGRGFCIMGLRRLHLKSKGAALFGLTNQQALVYCRPPILSLDQKEPEPPSQCLVLLLRKENALRHSLTLPAALMRELKTQLLLGCICSRRHDDRETVNLSLCFHTVPYKSDMLKIFVRRMFSVPNPSDVILSRHMSPLESDMEQVVILILCGKDMRRGLSLLQKILAKRRQDGVQCSAFRLLGLKRLPVLTRLQAKELSPYEVGEQLYQGSLDHLISSPALVCALKGEDAFRSLRKLLPRGYPGDLSVLMSPTPEVALRQASLFFFDHEMIPDAQMQLTVFLYKPSDWNRTLATTLLKLQRSGLMLVGLRVVTLDKMNASSLLFAQNDTPDSEGRGQFLHSGSSLALCLSGENAVQKLLDMLGQEDSSLWTAFYGSGTYQRAIEDVKWLFPEWLCYAKSSTMRQEQIRHLGSDPFCSVERQQSHTLVLSAEEGLSPLMVSGPNGGTLVRVAPWQTTCLLLSIKDPPLSHSSSQLDMLEQLLRSGCHLVAGRLSRLDIRQRQHIAKTLSCGAERMTHVASGPCLIVALQGEKIVTCFNWMLQSICKERPDLQKVRKWMIYPESEKEAQQLICYLFDALSPESCCNIVPLSSV